jgi:hypothetical protein
MTLKAVFIYTDERGKPVLRKVRGTNDTKGKDFHTEAARYRHDRLYWKKGRRVVERVQPDWRDRIIYNLPVVLDALRAGDDVWFAEGERDADTLAMVGRVAATTIHQGISRMTPLQAKWFVPGDSTINIVMDNDEAGAFGAWSRYMTLTDAGVAQDRLKLWRPGKDFKDVTEAVLEVGLRRALVKATRRRTRDAAIRYGTTRAALAGSYGEGDGVNPNTGFVYRFGEDEAEQIRAWKRKKAGSAS